MENFIITQFLTLGTATQVLLITLALLAIWKHFTTKVKILETKDCRQQQEQNEMKLKFTSDLGEMKIELKEVKASVNLLSNSVQSIAERQKEQDRNITKILTLLIEEKRK